MTQIILTQEQAKKLQNGTAVFCDIEGFNEPQYRIKIASPYLNAPKQSVWVIGQDGSPKLERLSQVEIAGVQSVSYDSEKGHFAHSEMNRFEKGKSITDLDFSNLGEETSEAMKTPKGSENDPAFVGQPGERLCDFRREPTESEDEFFGEVKFAVYRVGPDSTMSTVAKKFLAEQSILMIGSFLKMKCGTCQYQHECDKVEYYGKALALMNSVINETQHEIDFKKFLDKHGELPPYILNHPKDEEGFIESLNNTFKRLSDKFDLKELNLAKEAIVYHLDLCSICPSLGDCANNTAIKKMSDAMTSLFLASTKEQHSSVINTEADKEAFKARGLEQVKACAQADREKAQALDDQIASLVNRICDSLDEFDLDDSKSTETVMMRYSGELTKLALEFAETIGSKSPDEAIASLNKRIAETMATRFMKEDKAKNKTNDTDGFAKEVAKTIIGNLANSVTNVSEELSLKDVQILKRFSDDINVFASNYSLLENGLGNEGFAKILDNATRFIKNPADKAITKHSFEMLRKFYRFYLEDYKKNFNVK